MSNFEWKVRPWTGTRNTELNVQGIDRGRRVFCGLILILGGIGTSEYLGLEGGLKWFYVRELGLARMEMESENLVISTEGIVLY